MEKEIKQIVITAIIVFGIIIWSGLFMATGQAERKCIELGGVPNYDWNSSHLKICQFK
jgi:hypothetical protein